MFVGFVSVCRKIMSFDETQNLAERTPDELPSADAPAPHDAEHGSSASAPGAASVGDDSAPASTSEPQSSASYEEVAQDEAAQDEGARDEVVAEEEPEEEPYVERPPVELAEPEPEVPFNWYILKVQSNREESIRDGLMRRVKVAGLENYVKDIIVPTETVTEFKNGKKRVVKRKLYPGYIVVNMAITDDTWFLVRETPGIGDFTGAAGKPSPMLPEEVAKIEQKEKAVETETPTLSIAFKPGDNVKINEGTFENFEGEVSAVDATNGRITVMINIFGRSTPVELEYWQVESV